MPKSASKLKDEPMVRKPILMPPLLIRQIEKLASNASEEEKRSVSFAEIVRRAVADYDPHANVGDEEMMEALLDSIIKSTGQTVQEVRRLNKKLDKTYKELIDGTNG